MKRAMVLLVPFGVLVLVIASSFQARLGSQQAQARLGESEFHQSFRRNVGALCQQFPDSYLRERDAQRACPDQFVRALTAAGQALRRRGQRGQTAPGRRVLGGSQRRRPHLRGYGFAEGHDIERKFRLTRLYQVAPISTNLILSYVAEHVLGLPRSY